MIDREIKLPLKENYPVEQWRFVQKEVSQELIGRDESIFTTSNGYFGIRGSFEEGEPVLQPATFISGFYESWPIQYGEEAYGFAKTGQTMLNVTDAHQIKLFVDDEPFSLRHAYHKKFERALDLKKGLLERNLIWDTASGKQVSIHSERLVSFPERHLAAVKYTVTLLNADAYLAFTSEMTCEEHEQVNNGDPRKRPHLHHKSFIPEIQNLQDQRLILGHSIKNSKLKLVCGMDHQFIAKDAHILKSSYDEFKGRFNYTVEARKNQPVTLIKYITYHTSSPVPAIEDLYSRANRTLDRAKQHGYEKVKGQQAKYLKDFWYRSYIEIRGNDPQVNQNVRLHIYHLLQASARVQNSGIGAKGLTGSGYEGHSFWDIEIYMLPFLIYNNPRAAKNLLIYRYKMLDYARQRAKELNQEGALFPWRTINGEEASAFFAAGTAQFHINADIAFAIKKYSEITNDWEFLCEYGAEVLVETARLWADLGFYGKDKKFHIHGVTGPDEYNAVVNNNTFTNIMARENLLYAAEVLKKMKTKDPRKHRILIHKLNLSNEEVKVWQHAGKNMYIPYDQDLGINPQDDFFLQREVWDLKNTSKDKFPLLLNYHPLVLYRYQVIKQADVVLAMFLLGDEFSKELKKKNFDYYDPLTTGDSSLSACIQAIMAAELGYVELATKYFTYALLMDIANIGGNVEDGLHLASIGGIWMYVVYGAAGMRDYNGKLTFNPKLDGDINKIKFRLTIGANLLEVNVDPDLTTYTLREGDEFTFHHRRKKITLKNGEKKQVA